MTEWRGNATYRFGWVSIGLLTAAGTTGILAIVEDRLPMIVRVVLATMAVASLVAWWRMKVVVSDTELMVSNLFRREHFRLEDGPRAVADGDYLVVSGPGTRPIRAYGCNGYSGGWGELFWAPQLMKRVVSHVERETAARSPHPNSREASRWQRVVWNHDIESEPVVLYSEMRSDGVETRKVDQYRDGRLERAGQGIETDTTRLSTEPLPDLAKINSSEEFDGAEIAADQFEEVWQRASEQYKR